MFPVFGPPLFPPQGPQEGPFAHVHSISLFLALVAFPMRAPPSLTSASLIPHPFGET